MAATLRSDTGRVRKQNEDAVWFDEARGIFAVADGMGGHLAGEVASAMAMDAIRALAASDARPGVSALKNAVGKAQKAIERHAGKNPRCAGMGTTLSVMFRGGRYMYIAHIGDSRIYRLRSGELTQITQDHSLVDELVRAGLITREEARTHPKRNVITRALGTQGDNEPDLLAADTQPGDLWLLCTDGLNSMVSDGDIRDALLGRTLEQAADRLLELALDAGGRDNVTLILYMDEEA